MVQLRRRVLRLALGSRVGGTSMITDKDGKPGLRFESAASVIARNFVQQHLAQFHHVLIHDRTAGQSTAAAYIDGLAGCLAYIIAGQGDREGVTERSIKTLREAIERDLRHLGRPLLP